MSGSNYYETLGLDETATFEEIQEARNHLLQEHSSNRRQIEAIEAAYDAILMDRLRLRQEGKIKVPDRIRFPEKEVEPAPEFAPATSGQAPDWLQRLLDNPSRADVLWPAGLFLGTGLLSLTAPPVALALGVGFCFYFLNRKEHKFGRSFLLTLGGLVLGIVLGLWTGGLLSTQLAAIRLEVDTFAALVSFVILWLISSFLR